LPIFCLDIGETLREQLIYSLNKWLDFDGNGKIIKGELALAALAIGRFQPTTQCSGVSIFGKPMEATDRKTEPPQTRSIYIRYSFPRIGRIRYSGRFILFLNEIFRSYLPAFNRTVSKKAIPHL
jgi:hypothetical protein